MKRLSGIVHGEKGKFLMKNGNFSGISQDLVKQKEKFLIQGAVIIQICIFFNHIKILKISIIQIQTYLFSFIWSKIWKFFESNTFCNQEIPGPIYFPTYKSESRDSLLLNAQAKHRLMFQSHHGPYMTGVRWVSGLRRDWKPQSPWRTSRISVYPTEKQTLTLS